MHCVAKKEMLLYDLSSWLLLEILFYKTYSRSSLLKVEKLQHVHPWKYCRVLDVSLQSYICSICCWIQSQWTDYGFETKTAFPNSSVTIWIFKLSETSTDVEKLVIKWQEWESSCNIALGRKQVSKYWQFSTGLLKNPTLSNENRINIPCFRRCNHILIPTEIIEKKVHWVRGAEGHLQMMKFVMWCHDTLTCDISMQVEKGWNLHQDCNYWHLFPSQTL